MATIRGSVDFLSPEFLHALGIAVATFSRLEGLLQHAIIAARHGDANTVVEYSEHPETALEVYEATFSKKIDKLFVELIKRIDNLEARGYLGIKDDLHLARQARNFVVHGVWMRGSAEGQYQCSMVDVQGRTIKHDVDANILLSEATRAEHLMIEIKSLLVAERIYPANGPRIAG